MARTAASQRRTWDPPNACEDRGHHAPDAIANTAVSGGPSGPFRAVTGRIIESQPSTVDRRRRQREECHDPRPARHARRGRRTHRHTHGHRRRDRRRGRRPDVRCRQPGERHGHRDGPARWSRGRGSRRRRGTEGVRGPQGVGQLGGRQARPNAREVRGPHQGAHRGTGPAREPERRQADQRRARRGHRCQPRVRLLRRRRQQDLRPDDPGLEARPGHDPARADRRRGAHRAVELPAADGLVEGRAGPGRGQHRDPQARKLLPVDGAAARRARPRGRHPARRPQRRDRSGRDGRRVHRSPPGHRQGRVHRRDHDRPGDHATGRGQHQEDQPGARWQEPEHRLRRRGPREVRPRVALLRVRQRRPGLLRPQPDPRRAVRRRSESSSCSPRRRAT